MVRDSKVSVIAKVDLGKVRIQEAHELGLDFFNEIDVWAKMEFRSRDQSLGRKGSQQVLGTRPYSVREKLD